MSSMSIFVDALKLPTSRANRIHTSSPPGSFVTLSSLSGSTLRAPLSSPLSLREEYPSNILHGPRLRPIPLPPLSDEGMADNLLSKFKSVWLMASYRNRRDTHILAFTSLSERVWISWVGPLSSIVLYRIAYTISFFEESTPPPSPLSTSRPSLRSESPLSWHSDMDDTTESLSRPFYPYHYELPPSYTPPTPPPSSAHLHAPVTRYKPLPHWANEPRNTITKIAWKLTLSWSHAVKES